MAEKRILLLSIGLRKGGAENQLVKLARFLKGKGFFVTIAFIIKGNDFEDELKRSEIKFLFFNIRRPRGIWNLFVFVRSYRPSLVISFMYAANILGRIFKLLFGFPLITSVRNIEISNHYKLIYKMTYFLDDYTTFNSSYAMQKFIDFKLTSPHKSVTINNAIELHLQHDFSFNRDDVFTLVSIAHFRPQKDYATLFKAIQILGRKGIQVRLLVLGHLFDQKWPFDLIRELNLVDQIEILGYVDDPTKYLVVSDVLILSSLWEGTPNAILEGMAFKLPIIASDIPGSRELILESKAGYLFKPGDECDLAVKIEQMILENKQSRTAMGERGWEFVSFNFASHNVHAKWLNLIESKLT